MKSDWAAVHPEIKSIDALRMPGLSPQGQKALFVIIDQSDGWVSGVDFIANKTGTASRNVHRTMRHIVDTGILYEDGLDKYGRTIYRVNIPLVRQLLFPGYVAPNGFTMSHSHKVEYEFEEPWGKMAPLMENVSAQFETTSAPWGKIKPLLETFSAQFETTSAQIETTLAQFETNSAQFEETTFKTSKELSKTEEDAREALPPSTNNDTDKPTKPECNQYQNSTGTSESTEPQNEVTEPQNEVTQPAKKKSKARKKKPAKKEVKSKACRKAKFSPIIDGHDFSGVLAQLDELKPKGMDYEHDNAIRNFVRWKERYHYTAEEVACIAEVYYDIWLAKSKKEIKESRVKNPSLSQLGNYMENGRTWGKPKAALERLKYSNNQTNGLHGDELFPVLLQDENDVSTPPTIE